MDRREKEKQQKKRLSLREWAKKQTQGYEGQFLQLPNDVGFFKFSGAGTVELDIMPFVAGKNNPGAAEGEEYHEKEVHVHRVPTASGKSRPVLCRAHAFGKKCACCEWLRRNAGSADEELVKQVREKKRHLWLVNDKPGNANNSLKVMETTHQNRGQGFVELLGDAAATLEEDANPFSLTEGYIAILTIREFTQPIKYFAPTRIDFRKRKYDYPAALLKKAPCLDDMLIDPGYDEIVKLLESGGVDDEDPERAPERAEKDDEGAKPDPDGGDEDEDEGDGGIPDGLKKWMKIGALVTYKGEECQIKKITPSGLTLENEDADVYKNVPPSKVAEVETADEEPADEDEGEEDPPEKKRGAPSSKTRGSSDEEDEAPSRKTTTKAKRRDPDEDEEDDD